MNEELHERTVEVLTKLVDVLDCDDLSLLCWHCGVQTDELMPVSFEYQGAFKKQYPIPNFPTGQAASVDKDMSRVPF